MLACALCVARLQLVHVSECPEIAPKNMLIQFRREVTFSSGEAFACDATWLALVTLTNYLTG